MDLYRERITRYWKSGCRATAVVTRTVVISSSRIVIASIRSCATRRLKLITNPVAVRICQTVAVAVVTSVSIRARTVVVCCVSVEVARRSILATRYFKLIANSVGVSIREAVAIAVIARVSISTRTVIVCSVAVKVASRCIGTTRKCKLTTTIIILSAFVIIGSFIVCASTRWTLGTKISYTIEIIRAIYRLLAHTI